MLLPYIRVAHLMTGDLMNYGGMRNNQEEKEIEKRK